MFTSTRKHCVLITTVSLDGYVASVRSYDIAPPFDRPVIKTNFVPGQDVEYLKR
jgi:hypothetical protein